MSREKPAKKVKVEKTDGAKSTNGKRNEPAKIEAKMQNLKAKSGMHMKKVTKLNTQICDRTKKNKKCTANFVSLMK